MKIYGFENVCLYVCAWVSEWYACPAASIQQTKPVSYLSPPHLQTMQILKFHYLAKCSRNLGQSLNFPSVEKILTVQFRLGVYCPWELVIGLNDTLWDLNFSFSWADTVQIQPDFNPKLVHMTNFLPNFFKIGFAVWAIPQSDSPYCYCQKIPYKL